MSSPLRLVAKVLVTDNTCGQFIGKGGCRVQQLEHSSNTIINISGKGCYFPSLPNEQERVISITGFVLADIISVFDRLFEGIRENPRSAGKPQCILVLSDDGAGAVLGRGGETCRAMCRRYPTIRVNIEKTKSRDNERYVEITSGVGSYEDVRNCAVDIISESCRDGVIQLNNTIEMYKTSPRGETSSTLRYVRDKQRGSTSSSPPSPTWDFCFQSTQLASPPSYGDNIEGTVFRGNHIYNLINGRWVRDYGYSIFLVSKDRWGDVVFEPIDNN